MGKKQNIIYYKAINDWATLPSALKKLMPKTIFKYKLKQFLSNHFNLSSILILVLVFNLS